MIKDNFLLIQETIAKHCTKAHRSSDDVILIGVTKTKPVSVVCEALACGITHVGENRVQEALEKQEALPDNTATWHFIGSLQSNKVRKVVGNFAYIHSVDSIELAEKISTVAVELGIVQSCLMEVNLAGEGSKGGVSSSSVFATFNQVKDLPGIRWEGIMIIPPFDENPQKTRHYFATARALRDQLEVVGERPLPHLSMGMSHDFGIAIEEGATMVRVGTALFGGR